MTTRRRLTQAETEQLKTAKKRLALAEAKLAEFTERGFTATSSEYQLKGVVRRAKKDLAELNDSINARIASRTEKSGDELLAQIREEFPPPNRGGESIVDWNRKLSGEQTEDSQPVVETPRLGITEAEALLAKIHERLNGLKSDPLFNTARAYLTKQIDLLKGVLRELKDDEAARVEREKRDQANRDFLAGENDIAPLRTKFYARLAAGFLPLKLREETRQTFLKLAEENEHKQKQAVAIPPNENGVHPKAIFRARKYFYKECAERLAVFEWDLNREPSLTILDAEFWGSGQAVSPSNLNFRTKTEKALIVYVARKFYEFKNDVAGLSKLPNFPEPIRVPGKPPVSLEDIQRIETQRCLDALQPIYFEQIAETVYRVETATLENPHNPVLLLWPDGREVQVGVEVLFDRKSDGYRRMPEPMALEPSWSTGQRFESEQDAEGNWVKVPVSNGLQTEWIQNQAGGWEPDSSMPNGQWKRMPLLKVVHGDHKPTDLRTEFRYGHWWEPSQVQAAERSEFSLQMYRLPPETARTVADQIGTPISDTTPISPEESANCWRKRTAELRERNLAL